MLKTMVLCAGRHDVPENDGAIFPGELDPLVVTGVEQAAYNRLLDLFPEVTTRTTSLLNQADYTDIPVYYRGKLRLYVTGLSVALVAALNACRALGIDVELLHYDRESGGYYSQEVV